jgi:multidrug resistance efflux pump
MAGASDKKLPHITEAEQTPTVRFLMAFIEQQQETIQQQQTELEALKAEVARLKKLPKKPKIRPSKLSKDDADKGSGNPGKSNKPRKRKKKLTVHKTEMRAHACLDMRTTPSRIY